MHCFSFFHFHPRAQSLWTELFQLVPQPSQNVNSGRYYLMYVLFYWLIGWSYLQFEGVGVIGTWSEVSMNESPSAKGSTVRQLILFPVLRFYTFSVAVWRVSGSHCLTTYTNHKRWTSRCKTITLHRSVSNWNMFLLFLLICMECQMYWVCHTDKWNEDQEV